MYSLCIKIGAAPVSLSASSIDQSRFTFSWTPTVTCSSVTSYQVNADVANCGNCRYDGTGTNTATCSGWAANGQTCSVSVMSVICGGRTGEPSGSLDFVLQGMYICSCSILYRANPKSM